MNRILTVRMNCIIILCQRERTERRLSICFDSSCGLDERGVGGIEVGAGVFCDGLRGRVSRRDDRRWRFGDGFDGLLGLFYGF